MPTQQHEMNILAGSLCHKPPGFPNLSACSHNDKAKYKENYTSMIPSASASTERAALCLRAPSLQHVADDQKRWEFHCKACSASQGSVTRVSPEACA